MDRQTWLAERRSAVVAVYDDLAPAYDEHEYPSDLQREWVARVLRLMPPGGIVLDAPCGTGKYFAMVAAAGHQVAGVDQSAGMLAQARARGIAFQLEQAALQDPVIRLRIRCGHHRRRDGEHPARRLAAGAGQSAPGRPPGRVMYLTVEEVDQAEIDQAFQSLSARGLPVVRGEIIEGDVAGYHYYPGREQAAGRHAWRTR
jgi:hypothetical protein